MPSGWSPTSASQYGDAVSERDRLAEEYGALLDDEVRGPWNDLLALSRTVFPYVEEHKFFCDYWFLTRWWNKVREYGALLARQGIYAELFTLQAEGYLGR